VVSVAITITIISVTRTPYLGPRFNPDRPAK
jgi:hypothetical protein